MPLYSLKISTYDPEIIDAFERLRKSRKQATFTHEAIKQFLATERGKQVLANMDGGTSDQQLPVHTSMAVIKPADKPPNETMPGKSESGFVRDVDCTDVLNSILE
ncbi:hypothetical protein KI811_00195 [Geobacter hydrogenophilus]|uniref:Uncharacterized protein n=1 Tax=Geobacter hydrogenophilus TaxID=40983 RepID=A0A9W6LEF8_9BACT|nr:hypothetical protein [Geobacter hydrogenophilus]MBT0892236.1 hypothetical protein [Geobacter hydrogenophilus]GLI39629.1 hypothetical protein GHYDROH2_31300 [Geobacter hydrogenophilus]